MNTATIIGRAGQDAEIKYFESGKVKTTFSLAVNRWDSKTKEETTDWYNKFIFTFEWIQAATCMNRVKSHWNPICVTGSGHLWWVSMWYFFSEDPRVAGARFRPPGSGPRLTHHTGGACRLLTPPTQPP